MQGFVGRMLKSPNFGHCKYLYSATQQEEMASQQKLGDPAYNQNGTGCFLGYHCMLFVINWNHSSKVKQPWRFLVVWRAICGV